MKTTNLKISGMTCSACVLHVEQALRTVPGVQEVVVDLGAGRARVEHEDGAEAKLIEAVEEEGYQAEVEPPTVEGK
ncbi:MAG: heavy-metal-associated domain-containing protein [Verrucomicrobiaceae bacterium]|nr:MAG: heavy-metal-associated domain-containing protein [Verrucomicrobiaceae bacterium]